LSDDRFAATQFGDYSCCPFALAEADEIVAALWVSKLLLELLMYVCTGVGQLGQASGRGINLSFSWADH
jgi:hypothetical protein